MAPSRIHCVFTPSESLKPTDTGRENRYRVDAVNQVSGLLPSAPQAASQLLRIESATPFDSPSPNALYGVTGHLEYTTAGQAASLASSTLEFAADGERIRAVLIPIRKTEAWWSQPHDRRQAHFSESPNSPGHTNIGQSYVSRIFRRLYHSRYLARETCYDFLTYFEFDRSDESYFRELLARLRDPNLNPEWRYVDLETEIWMTKLT